MDKPTEVLTASMQPSPQQEFVTVFLEPSTPLSPHFRFSPGCGNSSLTLTLLCYKMDWTSALTPSRRQDGVTVAREARESCWAMGCPLVIRD